MHVRIDVPGSWQSTYGPQEFEDPEPALESEAMVFETTGEIFGINFRKQCCPIELSEMIECSPSVLICNPSNMCYGVHEMWLE